MASLWHAVAGYGKLRWHPNPGLLHLHRQTKASFLQPCPFRQALFSLISLSPPPVFLSRTARAKLPAFDVDRVIVSLSLLRRAGSFPWWLLMYKYAVGTLIQLATVARGSFNIVP